jgi:hypothetical protein
LGGCSAEDQRTAGYGEEARIITDARVIGST